MRATIALMVICIPLVPACAAIVRSEDMQHETRTPHQLMRRIDKRGSTREHERRYQLMRRIGNKTTGVKVEIDKCLVKDIAFLPSGLPDENATVEIGAAACQKRCSCLPSCTKFTFYVESQTCHVHGKDVQAVDAAGTIAGDPECGSDPHTTGTKSALHGDHVDSRCIGGGCTNVNASTYRPRVFIYDLPASSRDDGNSSECKTVACVFGGSDKGAPIVANGIEYWPSPMYDWPKMVWHRLLHSVHRTLDVNLADVFFIPAWQRFGTSNCTRTSDLMEELFRQNPLLRSDAARVAPRHILVNARGWENCPYMFDEHMPQGLFTRFNAELNSYGGGWPSEWRDGKPYEWYAYPYSSPYHGPVALAPARTRPSGYARYLWSFFGNINHGSASFLRQKLSDDCDHFGRCCLRPPAPSRIYDNGKLILKDLLEAKLQSTFCAEPPGDLVGRKSIFDSIVLGCIPVLFNEQILHMWDGFFTSEEFRAMIVFVPEAWVVAEPKLSPWATKAKQEPRPGLHGLTRFLLNISDEELRRKQRAIASLVPRVITAMTDDDHDAVATLLDLAYKRPAAKKPLPQHGRCCSKEQEWQMLQQRNLVKFDQT